MTTSTSAGATVQAISSEPVMGPPRGHGIGGLVEAPHDVDDEPKHQERNADRHREAESSCGTSRCCRRFRRLTAESRSHQASRPPKICAPAFGAASAAKSPARPALIAFERTRIPDLFSSLSHASGVSAARNPTPPRIRRKGDNRRRGETLTNEKFSRPPSRKVDPRRYAASAARFRHRRADRPAAFGDGGNFALGGAPRRPQYGAEAS